MLKTVRFSNLSSIDRTEVSYATVPFKKGEWTDSTPNFSVKDIAGNPVEAWMYPFGARYDDGSHRYGALLPRVHVQGLSDTVVTVEFNDGASEPQFRWAPSILRGEALDIELSVEYADGTNDSGRFIAWKVVESTGMRQIHQSVIRIGSFVGHFTLYLYNDQSLARWELDVTGSDPRTTKRIYEFASIKFRVHSGHYLNLRHAGARGVNILKPFKEFELLRGSQGFFGDGQKQLYYGEMSPVTNVGHEEALTASAAIEHEMWGMSQDWVECQEAFGALGAIPEPLHPLPNGGFHGALRKFEPIMRLMNSDDGNPWDDYPDGLTKTPAQTGDQFDFGLIKGWDVLWTGMGELIPIYRFLSTEDAKRPGHYLEVDGSPVTHARHPRRVVWDGVTHWHYGVSPDRLGKTDPNEPYATNAWRGKDWQHFSSHLLYLACLLTGSRQLRTEKEHEVELYLAGHTLPSEFPGWSTNSRGEARAFGRPHLTLLHSNTILDREDLIERMVDRFDEVVKDHWTGATSSPVKPWSLIRDSRVFANEQEAWVPWNNHLGWIGVYALWLATNKRKDIQEVMVGLATTIIRWGWRTDTVAQTAELGHGVKWFAGGRAPTEAEMRDPAIWLPVVDFNQEWGLAVAKFVTNQGAPLFDEVTKTKAAEIMAFTRINRLADHDATNPFDSYGEWMAI